MTKIKVFNSTKQAVEHLLSDVLVTCGEQTEKS